MQFMFGEKLNILKEKDNCLLNKRSEIISACQHKNRFQVKSLNKERMHAILMTTPPLDNSSLFSKLFTT